MDLLAPRPGQAIDAMHPAALVARFNAARLLFMTSAFHLAHFQSRLGARITLTFKRSSHEPASIGGWRRAWRLTSVGCSAVVGHEHSYGATRRIVAAFAFAVPERWWPWITGVGAAIVVIK